MTTMRTSHRRRVATNVIARRRLVGVNSKRPCTVEILKPVADGEDWRCDYRLVRAGRARGGYAMGIDGFQAIEGAILKLHALLADHGEPHVMHQAETHPFLPRFVPEVYGEQFARRVERLIKREAAREAAKLALWVKKQERRATKK